MTARAFAVLSAALLVIAVGLAALAPPGIPLGQGLLMLDGGAVRWIQAHTPAAAWNWVVSPFMNRPAWLPAAFLGLICAGLALTFNLGKPTTSRRRS